MNKTAAQAVQDLKIELLSVLMKFAGTMKDVSIGITDNVLTYGNVVATHVHRPYPKDTGGDDNENCFIISLKRQVAGEEGEGAEVFDREAVREVVLTYVLDNILPTEK